MVYDPSTPIDTVYNTVQELVDFSEQAQDPFLQSQAINMALVILLCTGTFGANILFTDFFLGAYLRLFVSP